MATPLGALADELRIITYPQHLPGPLRSLLPPEEPAPPSSAVYCSNSNGLGLSQHSKRPPYVSAQVSWSSPLIQGSPWSAPVRMKTLGSASAINNILCCSTTVVGPDPRRLTVVRLQPLRLGANLRSRTYMVAGLGLAAPCKVWSSFSNGSGSGRTRYAPCRCLHFGIICVAVTLGNFKVGSPA